MLKMKKYISILWSFSLFALFSCQAVVKKIYNIKQPKPEDRTSINKYLLKTGLDTNSNYLIKPSFYTKALKVIDSSLPNALFFDKNGRNIIYHPNGSKCDGYVLPFIKKFKSDSIFIYDNNIDRSTLINMIEDNQKSLANIEEKTIFIFWFIPIGNLNKTFTKKWELEANQKGFKVIKVNMDMQKGVPDSVYIIKK